MSFNAIITADVKNFEAGIDKAIGDIDKLAKTAREKTAAIGKSFENLAAVGKSFENVGKKASILSAALIAAGGASFKMAADFQDAMGATDQIYKESSKAVKDWADSLPSMYGVAKSEALEYANLMGSMLTNIGGLTEEQAAKQSASLIELAGDLSAMFGGSTESAVKTLTGALKGNNAMLDNYGMAVTDSLVKARAFELGLAAQGEELSLNAKQAATLSLIYEQTGAAQGQAAREADGASGSMRALGAEMKNLSIELGDVLLPIITPIVTRLKEFVSGLRDLSPEAKKTIVVVAGIVAAIGPLLLILGTIVGKVVPAMIIGFKALKVAVKTTGGAFAKLRVIIAANPIGAIAVGITAVIAALVIFNRRLSDTATLSDKIMTDALKNTAGERVEVERLLRVLNSEKATREQKEKVLVKLNKISPEYFKNIKLEGDAIKTTNEQAVAYNKSLVEQARLHVINEKLVELERKRIDELEGGDDSKLSFWQKLVKNTLIANGELASSDDFVTKTREANAEKSKTAYETQRDSLLALLDVAEEPPPPPKGKYVPVFVDIKEAIQDVGTEWDSLLAEWDKDALKIDFDDFELEKPFAKWEQIMDDYQESLRQSAVSSAVFGDSFSQLDGDINATTRALQELIREGFVPGDMGVDALMSKLATLREGLQETAAVVVDYGSIIAGGITDFAASIGEAFADGNFDDLGSGLISAMGSMLSQFGAMLISAAIASDALQVLITQPWLALAAGFALVALGAAASKSAQGMVSKTTGGGSSGGTNSYNKTSSLGDSSYRGAYKDDWGEEVVFKIGNNELVGVLENASNRRNRL